MPKKRHLHKYSKPQSTPPALLSSRNNSRQDEDDTSSTRSVNALLAGLRRAGLNSSTADQRAPDTLVNQPTVPPSIRQILQIPETPPPRPRRPPIRLAGPAGRLPAGPAPPRSWLSGPERADVALRQSTTAAAGVAGQHAEHHRPLPGGESSTPARGSLLDMVLRRFALDWEWQKVYCQYHLYELPTHLRVALVGYLVRHRREGVTLGDLRAVLLPPPDVPEYAADPALAPGVMNEAFRCLDLSGSVGRGVKLRELTEMLFPPAPSGEQVGVRESWDDDDDEQDSGDDDDDDSAPQRPAAAAASTIPRALLPNLTHLSLALDPSTSPAAVSWRHLLALAAHLPGLTHLSLAFWPEPALLAPSARLATVVSPLTGRALQYGGTGPYSHSLDDDWAEAVLVLRRLSRLLYGLEYLDLTGCAAWAPALWVSSPGVGVEVGARGRDGNGAGGGEDTVDWAGAWGKVATLVMYPGYRLVEDAGTAERARYWELVDYARRVERHVRSRRAGKGRFITVETCKRPEE